MYSALPLQLKTNKQTNALLPSVIYWTGVLKQRPWIPGPQLMLCPTWDWLQNFSKRTEHRLPWGHFKGIWDDFHLQPVSGESKKGAGEDLQGLEDTCLQCWWGAVMSSSCPSDQNCRSCLGREKSMALPALKLMLAWNFSFWFFSDQEVKNYWVTLLKKKFLFKFSWVEDYTRWRLLLPLSTELHCLSVRWHPHAFICVSCFLLLPASLRLRHNMI